jgi:hypothetical protein
MVILSGLSISSLVGVNELQHVKVSIFSVALIKDALLTSYYLPIKWLNGNAFGGRGAVPWATIPAVCSWYGDILFLYRNWREKKLLKHMRDAPIQ